MTNMPRIAPVTEPYADDVAASLKGMMGKGRDIEPLSLFRTMVTHMPLVRAFGPLGRYMLASPEAGGASYDLRSRKIVIDRVTARCGCEYEWGVHIAGYAEKAGFGAVDIASIVHGSGTDACWSPRDRALIDMVDNLHDSGKLSDAAWDALSEHFEHRQILDLFVLAGWYHAISYIANGAQVAQEHWAVRFPVEAAA